MLERRALITVIPILKGSLGHAISLADDIEDEAVGDIVATKGRPHSILEAGALSVVALQTPVVKGIRSVMQIPTSSPS